MEEELWRELQKLALGREEPEILIPQRDYADMLVKNRLSLIARPLNPQEQNLHSVALILPRLWGLSNRVHGRVLDDRFIQFRFQDESDLEMVQGKEPWSYNSWFVACQRWEDVLPAGFLSTISLWVRIRGIPLPYVSKDTVNRIAGKLGDIVETDFNDDTTDQIAYIRVKIRFDITEKFRFFRRVRFQSGERTMIGLQYENMRRLCTNCCRIMHSTNRCPFLPPARNPFYYQDRQADEESTENESNESIFPPPISQPPSPVIPGLTPEGRNKNRDGLQLQPRDSQTGHHFALAFPCFAAPKTQESVGSNINTDKRWMKSAKFEIGECSKRKTSLHPKYRPFKKRTKSKEKGKIVDLNEDCT